MLDLGSRGPAKADPSPAVNSSLSAATGLGPRDLVTGRDLVMLRGSGGWDIHRYSWANLVT